MRESRRPRGKIVQKRGNELRAGDIIEVWWRPSRDLIVALEPYRGPHAELFPSGAQVASFGMSRAMMIDNEELYGVILPESTP